MTKAEPLQTTGPTPPPRSSKRRGAALLGVLAVLVSSPGSCAVDDSYRFENSTGGAGGSDTAVECGDTSCQPIPLPLEQPPLMPCCADAETASCGIDTQSLNTLGLTPANACEPLHQPGELDPDECDPSPPIMPEDSSLVLTFQGCCRAATGLCGYLMNTVLTVVAIGLGCVDSTPFLDGAEPASCTPGGDAGGAGGAENAGGAGNTASADNAAGADNAGGAGGASDP